MDVSVPTIIRQAVEGACGEIGVEPKAMDVGSIGAVCNFSLNEQGLHCCGACNTWLRYEDGKNIEGELFCQACALPRLL